MMDTQQIFAGSTPSFSAMYVLAMAPNICWGDFAVERFGMSSGYSSCTNRSQPGQQEVNIGHG